MKKLFLPKFQLVPPLPACFGNDRFSKIDGIIENIKVLLEKFILIFSRPADDEKIVGIMGNEYLVEAHPRSDRIQKGKRDLERIFSA